MFLNDCQESKNLTFCFCFHINHALIRSLKLDEREAASKTRMRLEILNLNDKTQTNKVAYTRIPFYQIKTTSNLIILHICELIFCSSLDYYIQYCVHYATVFFHTHTTQCHVMHYFNTCAHCCSLRMEMSRHYLRTCYYMI